MENKDNILDDEARKIIRDMVCNNWKTRLEALKQAEKYLNCPEIKNEIVHRALTDNAVNVRQVACRICNINGFKHKGHQVTLRRMGNMLNNKKVSKHKASIKAVINYFIKRNQQAYFGEFVSKFNELYPSEYDFIEGRLLTSEKIHEWFRNRLRDFSKKEIEFIVNFYDKKAKKDEDKESV